MVIFKVELQNAILVNFLTLCTSVLLNNDSSVAAVLAESRKEQRDGPRCTDDGRTKFDGEVGGDGQRSSGDGGQYVIRRGNDGEMERVLEKQAELIGQYEAEEKAQTDWEKNFNDTRSSLNKVPLLLSSY